MNEIRIRQRPFLIVVTSVSILIVYLLFRTCEKTTVLSTPETAEDGLTNLPSERSLPFTVYAITPTYARPVQKAELTRYIKSVNQMRTFKIHKINRNQLNFSLIISE